MERLDIELNPQAGRSVLVVDDNEINRRVASAMLKRIGFTHIVDAEDGLVALEQVKSAMFDLIVMDCEMPIMDGFESTRQIRNWEQTHQLPTCPIFAVTARLLEDDESHCLNAGMTRYLTKPLSFEPLQAAIRKQFGIEQEGVLVGESETSTVDADPTTPIDGQRYDKMCLLLRDGIDEFYRDYLAATREKLLQIQTQAEMPLELSARLIHSIRGSAANVGAQQLHDVAARLEQRLEAGETRVLHQEIRSMSQVLKDFEVAIQARLRL